MLFRLRPTMRPRAPAAKWPTHLMRLVLTACAFPVLTRALPADVGDLLAHLQWWLAEEAVHADDYQPNYGILQGRAADLGAVLSGVGPEGYAPDAYPAAVPDPVFAAIEAADAAAEDHAKALAGLDEDDKTQMRRANAAADAASEAFVAVERTMPTTWSGLLALVEFYGRDLEMYDRCSHGGGYFAHLATAMRGCESSEAFWASAGQFPERDQAVAGAIPQADFQASEQVAA